MVCPSIVDVCAIVLYFSTGGAEFYLCRIKLSIVSAMTCDFPASLSDDKAEFAQSCAES